jgi:hypothetical protein
MNDRAMQQWAEKLRETRPWTEQTARVVLRKQRDSGDGVTAFARRIGVSPQRLFWWRARLAAHAASNEQPARTCDVPRLVPVVVQQKEAVEAVSATPLVVRIGEHVRVDVRHPDAASAAWVALLAAGCIDGGMP